MERKSGRDRCVISRRQFLQAAAAAAGVLAATSASARAASPGDDPAAARDSAPARAAGTDTRKLYLPVVQQPFRRPQTGKTLFAPHWIPYHFEAGDASFFGEWRPGFVKILCDDLDVPYVNDVPQDAAIIVRHYPSSELYGQRGFLGYSAASAPAWSTDSATYYRGQGSGRDLLRQAEILEAQGSLAGTLTPEQAAEMQVGVAQQMAERLKARGHKLDRFWFEGLNEPMFWSVEPPEAVARLERRRLELMHAAGLNSLVLNAGVGWPGNGGGEGAPVQWDWFKPVVEVWGSRDLLGLHEYCGFNGPQENWGWWMGRYRQCPFAIPILISESGIDGGVSGQAGAGWLDLPPPTIAEKAKMYIGQLAWYEQEMWKDSRIQGTAIFTYDGGTEHWGPYNIKRGEWQAEWLAWLATLP